MRLLTSADLRPTVRIANYHEVYPDQSWPHRVIPDLQVILIIRGLFLYREEEGERAPRELLVHAGELLWIEPARRHTFCHAGGQLHGADSTGLIAGFHFECLPRGAWAAGDYRLAQSPEAVTRVADFGYMHERFRRNAAIFRSYLPQRELLMSTIAQEILLLLLGHWQQPATATLSARMEEMIAFIRANLRQPLSRTVLAAAFSLTPEHVNLLFRRELGVTPSTVINRERVMSAYKLIHEEGHSVKEAAYAVGYHDPFYFSRVFKQILGIPPSQVG